MINKKEQLNEEAARLIEKAEKKNTILYEKWAKTDIGRGSKYDELDVDLVSLMDKNPHKARLVAKAIDNQEKHCMDLREAVIQSTFSTTPENLLKVVKKGVANSNRSEMFTELALDTTDDALYFIDMTHESTNTGRQPTAGDKIFENAYEYTAGEVAYADQVGDADTTVSITADITPIKAYKVHVTLDDKLVGYDDGAGAITLVGTDLASGTIDYTTGALALVFSAAVEATSTVRMYYHWDSENSGNYDEYPKVSLTISKKRFQARPMMLGYSYSEMARLTLDTQMKEDAGDLLMNAVSAEHARSRDFKAIAYARNVANSNQTYTFNTKFADEGEVAYKNHAQRLLHVINSIGGQINDSLLRGRVSTIIAGNLATSYMRLNDLWTEDTSQPSEGVHKAGKLGNIDVFTCPASPTSGQLLGTTEMLLAYKNPLQPLDVSVAFGVLTELFAALSYPQFYTDGNIAVVEDKMLITREFVRLLTLENLDTYQV
jgi:hypothetical protein